jgi:hypothetical protein
MQMKAALFRNITAVATVDINKYLKKDFSFEE